ncbi:MAG: hypothetical protein NZM43_11370 [Saprospiraceae bacterium]|nr:hypothetical protein [Saprospiraceae bacterium]MDW8484908.1 hypothetical protein [Saprospiraceae bacterium]
MEDIPSSTDNPASWRIFLKHGLWVFGWVSAIGWATSVPLPAGHNKEGCGGISFSARGQRFNLIYPLGQEPQKRNLNTRLHHARLDTISNWYSPSRRYVEIIRQDHPTQPLYGLALGFEFHEKGATFPYKPAYARAHFKDFSWGGVEFSRQDSFNYTGVTNEISHDLTIRILSFQKDTIRGIFYGLLLSGAGPMLHIDSGVFCVPLRRLPD